MEVVSSVNRSATSSVAEASGSVAWGAAGALTGSGAALLVSLASTGAEGAVVGTGVPTGADGADGAIGVEVSAGAAAGAWLEWTEASVAVCFSFCSAPFSSATPNTFSNCLNTWSTISLNSSLTWASGSAAGGLTSAGTG